MKKSKIKTFGIAISILFLACFCAYINSLFYGFVLDDISLVAENPYIKNLSAAGQVLQKGLWDFAYEGNKPAYYRPIQTISYMFDYRIWQLNPFGYHFTNVLLHFFNATLVFIMLYLLFNNFFLAIASGIFFSIHPINSSTVAYISARADLVAALFILLIAVFSIALFKFPQKRECYLAGIMIFSLAALFSRENSLILPVVVLFLIGLVKGKGKEKSYVLLATILLVIFYLFLRIKTLNIPFSAQAHFTLNPVFKIINFLYILVSYLALLIIPAGLYLTHVSSPILSWTDSRLWVVLAFYIIGIILWFNRRNNKIINFSIFWFLIFISPVFFVMDTFNKTKLCMSESWAYLSAIGFYTLISFLFYLLWLRRRAFAFCLITVIYLLYTAVTINSNAHFKNRLALAEHIIGLDPTNKEAHKELASVFLNKKRYADALNHINIGIGLDAQDPDFYLLKGMYYEDAADTKKAIACYEELLEIEPRSARGYNNLGAIYFNQGDFASAAVFFKKAIELNPMLAEPYLNMAKLATINNDWDGAVVFYEQVIRLNQDIEEPFINLAKIYLDRRDFKKAAAVLSQALASGHNEPLVLVLAGITYGELGFIDKTEYYFKEALKAGSSSEDVMLNIGVFYANHNQLKKAVEIWREALSKNPGNKTIQENINKAEEILRQ